MKQTKKSCAFTVFSLDAIEFNLVLSSLSFGTPVIAATNSLGDTMDLTAPGTGSTDESHVHPSGQMLHLRLEGPDDRLRESRGPVQVQDIKEVLVCPKCARRLYRDRDGDYVCVLHGTVIYGS